MDNEWEWRQLCFCYSLSHLLGLNPNCTELGERLVFIGSVKQGASKTFHNIIIKVKCQLLFDNISKGLWINSMKLNVVLPWSVCHSVRSISCYFLKSSRIDN